MNRKTTKARITELAMRAEEAVEFAVKLRTGELVARSPLFVKGKKVPLAKRHIEIYKPRGRTLEPGMIAADSAMPRRDPHVAYAITGKRQNYVQVAKAPVARTKEAAMKNVGDLAGIRRALIGHFDHSKITSRTHASAFSHESVPTAKLVRSYGKMGYKIDRPAVRDALRQARPGGRDYASDLVRE